MIVEELKKSILKVAFQGKITEQLKTDSNSKETIIKIAEIKQKNIKEKKYKKTPIGKEILDEDKEYEIPQSWEWVRFIDLCSVMTCGYASTPQYVNEGMPFLSAKNVKPYKFMPEDYKLISNELYEKLTVNCKPGKKDILLTRVGAGIGESAIIDIDMDFAIYVSLTLIKLVDYDLINNKYILYWLNSPYGIRTSINNITGKESSQGNLNVDDVRNFMIPFPPIEEQERIVSKIEELFLKLDEIKPIEEELNFLKNKFPEDIKNSILQEAYEGKWSNDYASWNKKKINEICNEVCTGNSISESIKKTKYMNLAEGYNYIGTKDLNFDHSFDYENGVKIPFDEPKFRYANSKDILLCIEGGSAGKKIGILEEKVCYGNKLCKFDVKNEVLPEFLYYYLQSPIFLKNFYDNLSGIIGGVSISKIRTIEFEYPDIEEQKRIVEKIEEILPIIESINNMY